MFDTIIGVAASVDAPVDALVDASAGAHVDAPVDASVDVSVRSRARHFDCRAVFRVRFQITSIRSANSSRPSSRISRRTLLIVSCCIVFFMIIFLVERERAPYPLNRQATFLGGLITFEDKKKGTEHRPHPRFTRLFKNFNFFQTPQIMHLRHVPFRSLFDVSHLAAGTLFAEGVLRTP